MLRWAAKVYFAIMALFTGLLITISISTDSFYWTVPVLLTYTTFAAGSILIHVICESMGQHLLNMGEELL